MKGPYLVGTDIGTSGTKSAIFDSAGDLVAEAYVESKLNCPAPGVVEQDQMEFYESALTTIRECVEKAGINPHEVAGIGVDGQMAGIGAIDEEWNPVTVYDSWLDTRCEPYIQRILDTVGDQVVRLTGCAPSYNHGPKMLWWKHERPEAFRRIARFVVPGAFVAGRMAGLRAVNAFVDHTYLHFTGVADARKREWSDELCEALDVPKRVLPRIVEPWSVIGRLTRESADRCGLVQGTPIVAGAGDTAAGLLGSGVTETGVAIDVAGTASVLAVCIPGYCPDLVHRTMSCARSAIPGVWYSYAYINGGGLCLRWFRDEFCKYEKEALSRAGVESMYDVLNSEADQVPPGSSGLIFIPHLAGRVSPNQPGLRGTWHGFSWSHTRAHFYRAMLEAIAYEYAVYMRILKGLQPGVVFREVRGIAGGARSMVWNHVKADVLGIPYAVLSRSEFSVLGAAMIAGKGVGLFSDLGDTARAFVKVISRVEPRPESRRVYDSMIERYEDLLHTCLDLQEAWAQG